MISDGDEEVDLIILLALSPILMIILLLLLKRPLSIAAPITYLYTLFIAIWIWNMNKTALYFSGLKGLFVAVDIGLIVFGAIFFLEFLKSTKLLESIEGYLCKISPDIRIQAILLVWFFGSFIEGTAGFGTPAAIVAPLLIGIGFPLLTAVSIALIGNSTAVAFGAVGTPIRVGFSGLEVAGVEFYAGLINLFTGLFVPLMILAVVVILSKNRTLRAFYEAVPFALFAGLCFMIPYFLLTFLGQEFPSLLGPIIGGAIILFSTKKGFLVPSNTMTFRKKNNFKQKERLMKALMPYGFLILFLIAGKFLMVPFSIELSEGISHNFNLLNPGIAFILSIIVFSLVFKIKFSKLRESIAISFKSLLIPFIVIFSIVSFVQTMIYSGLNQSGLESMIVSLIKIIPTAHLLLVAPLIGAFGAFVTGSATLSNILFGAFQDSAARTFGFNPLLILALQLVGAGIGNIIALTNIVAAQAAVKTHGKELDILKIVIVPCLILLIIATLMGLILARFF